MTPFATITCYADLVGGLRARKEALGLSDAVLDAVAGLTPGHTNKCLGPSLERGIGASTLEAYLIALAFDLVMVESKAKLALMQPHYEKRSAGMVRTKGAIGDRVLSRAMSKLNKERWARVAPKDRSEIMRNLILKRWGTFKAKTIAE
jgi:hypothetical protein